MELNNVVGFTVANRFEYLGSVVSNMDRCEKNLKGPVCYHKHQTSTGTHIFLIATYTLETIKTADRCRIEAFEK